MFFTKLISLSGYHTYVDNLTYDNFLLQKFFLRSKTTKQARRELWRSSLNGLFCQKLPCIDSIEWGQLSKEQRRLSHAIYFQQSNFTGRQYFRLRQIVSSIINDQPLDFLTIDHIRNKKSNLSKFDRDALSNIEALFPGAMFSFCEDYIQIKQSAYHDPINLIFSDKFGCLTEYEYISLMYSEAQAKYRMEEIGFELDSQPNENLTPYTRFLIACKVDLERSLVQLNTCSDTQKFTENQSEGYKEDSESAAHRSDAQDSDKYPYMPELQKFLGADSSENSKVSIRSRLETDSPASAYNSSEGFSISEPSSASSSDTESTQNMNSRQDERPPSAAPSDSTVEFSSQGSIRTPGSQIDREYQENAYNLNVT